MKTGGGIELPGGISKPRSSRPKSLVASPKPCGYRGSGLGELCLELCEAYSTSK